LILRGAKADLLWLFFYGKFIVHQTNSKMTIVKTSNPEWFGIKTTIFAAGEIHPHKETGEFEVHEDHLQDVLESYDHISVVGEEGKQTQKPKEEKIKEPGEDGEEIEKKSDEDELNKKEETITGEVTKQEEVIAPAIEVSVDEKEKMIAELETKTRAELQALCAAFPRKEWGNLNKGELIEFLKTKLA
jgi:hypothetical protein